MSWTVVSFVVFVLGLFTLVMMVIYRLHHPASNGHGATLEGIWDGRTERRKSPR